MGGCIYNIYGTLKSYIDKETLQTVSLEPPRDRVHFPSLAICPPLAEKYRNDSKQMLTLDDYNENAFDPNDFNVTITYDYFKNISSKYIEDYLLFTDVFGKCIYLEMDEKVGIYLRNLSISPSDHQN